MCCNELIDFKKNMACFYDLHSESLNFDKCGIGHPSDDVWDKFGFHLLTPPLSPEQSLNEITPDSADCLLTPDCSEEDFCDAFINNSASPLPDLKDTVDEYLGCDVPVAADGYSKIRQDCMWNGRNDPRQNLLHRRSRSNSPAFLSSSLESGCIDPEYLFNTGCLYNHNTRIRASNSRRSKTEIGPETPNDSEEEVDVVSLENELENSASTFSQPISNFSISNGTKVFGTLVQQNGLRSHLALISAANSNQMNKVGNKVSAKANAKTVSMFVSNGDDRQVSKKTIHLKCVSLVNATVAPSHTTKRKVSSSEKQPAAVFQLMRFAPTSASNPEKENAVRVSKKRRIHSLDGVSMISDTGIKRKSSCGKRSLLESKVKVEPLAKLENSSSALLAEMKKPKKYTKRSAPPDYESPTSSPDNCSSGDLSPPKRRSPTGRCSGSSSGSDEDSVRVAHNVLERQRREGLRNLYHVLRKKVPEVAENERAAKVSILTKAKEHVNALKHENEKLQMQKHQEKQKHDCLRQRLHNLVSELTYIDNSTSWTPTCCDLKTEAFGFMEKIAIISK